ARSRSQRPHDPEGAGRRRRRHRAEHERRHAVPDGLAERGRSADAAAAELGADPRLPNDEGSTPLIVAAGVGTHSPAEDPGSEEEVLEAVKLTLELGNDIDESDSNGNTAMHGAAFKQVPAVAQYLAQRGARIEIWNRKNAQGWTPLRIAAGVFR